MKNLPVCLIVIMILLPIANDISYVSFQQVQAQFVLLNGKQGKNEAFDLLVITVALMLA